MALFLLGDGDSWVTLTAAAIGVVLVAAGAFLAKYLPEKRKSTELEAAIRKDAYEAATSSFELMFQRQEEQTNRLASTMLAQDRSIARLYDLNAECREESAELLGFAKLIYSILQQHHRGMTKAGLKPDPIPPMPDFDGRRQQMRAREAEYIRRSSEQARDLVSATGDSLHNEVRKEQANVQPPGDPAS